MGKDFYLFREKLRKLSTSGESLNHTAESSEIELKIVQYIKDSFFNSIYFSGNDLAFVHL